MDGMVEVVPGVRVSAETRYVEFMQGSLEGLAQGLRDVLWEDLALFRDAETLVVHVGGDHSDCQYPPLEVDTWQPGVPHETILIPHSLWSLLEAVREENMPDSQYANWSCDCDEYCDQDHGEGRIDLFVFKPSFHELAVHLG